MALRVSVIRSNEGPATSSTGSINGRIGETTAVQAATAVQPSTISAIRLGASRPLLALWADWLKTFWSSDQLLLNDPDRR